MCDELSSFYSVHSGLGDMGDICDIRDICNIRDICDIHNIHT